MNTTSDAIARFQRSTVRDADRDSRFRDALAHLGNLYGNLKKLRTAADFDPEKTCRDQMKLTANAYLDCGPWKGTGGVQDILERTHLSKCAKLVIQDLEPEIDAAVVRLATVARGGNEAALLAHAIPHLRQEARESLPADLALQLKRASANLV